MVATRPLVKALAAVACAALAILASPGLRDLDRNLYLSKFPSAASRTPHVVIVDIDNASLERLGGWPLDRGLHATAIENAFRAGARVLVFDLMFIARRGAAGDTRLGDAARIYRNTVFAYQFTNRAEARLFPALAQARPSLGHIDVYAPGKGSLITAIPVFGNEESLALAAARIFCSQPGETCKPRIKVSSTDMLYESTPGPVWGVDYSLPVTAFPRVPFHQLVTSAPPTLAGKVAIVSPSATVLNDFYRLPSDGGLLHPGALINAYAVETAIAGSSIRVLPQWLLASLLVVANSIVLLLASRRPKRLLILFSLFTGLLASVHWMAFRWQHIHLPVSVFLLDTALLLVAAFRLRSAQAPARPLA